MSWVSLNSTVRQIFFRCLFPTSGRRLRSLRRHTICVSLCFHTSRFECLSGCIAQNAAVSHLQRTYSPHTRNAQMLSPFRWHGAIEKKEAGRNQRKQASLTCDIATPCPSSLPLPRPLRHLYQLCSAPRLVQPVLRTCWAPPSNEPARASDVCGLKKCR